MSEEEKTVVELEGKDGYTIIYKNPHRYSHGPEWEKQAERLDYALEKVTGTALSDFPDYDNNMFLSVRANQLFGSDTGAKQLCCDRPYTKGVNSKVITHIAYKTTEEDETIIGLVEVGVDNLPPKKFAMRKIQVPNREDAYLWRYFFNKDQTLTDIRHREQITERIHQGVPTYLITVEPYVPKTEKKGKEEGFGTARGRVIRAGQVKNADGYYPGEES